MNGLLNDINGISRYSLVVKRELRSQNYHKLSILSCTVHGVQPKFTVMESRIRDIFIF